MKRWSTALTEQLIQGGVPRSVRELDEVTLRHIKTTNHRTKPFIWTKMVHEIMARFALFGEPIHDSGRWLSESRDQSFIMCKLVESNDGMDGWCPKLKLKNRTTSRDRRACELIGMHRRSWRYRQKERNEVALRARLRELPSGRPRFGFQGLYIFPKREDTEEGTLHAGGCDLRQAEDFCIVFNRARSCPRFDATLWFKPWVVARFSLRARGVAGLVCCVAAVCTRI